MAAEPNGYQDYYATPVDMSGPSAVRYYLGVLRRRFWIVLSVAVILGTIGIVRVYRTAPVYRAVTRILVERHAPSHASLQGVVRNYPLWDPDYYTTQAGLLRSRVVMERVLATPEVAELFAADRSQDHALPHRSFWQELRQTVRAVMGTPPAPPPEPWERLRSRIQTSLAKDMHMILVTATSGNAGQAAMLANAAAHAFEAYHKERQAEALGAAFSYLQTEKAKTERQLREAEEALQAFRESARGVSLSVSEEYQPNRDRLDRLNARITSVQLERSGLSAQIQVLEDISGSLSDYVDAGAEKLFAIPVIRQHTGLSGLRDTLVEAEKALMVFADTYGPQHPQLRVAETNVVLLRDEFSETLRQVIISDRNQLKMLAAEDASLSAQYEDEKKTALGLAREAFTFTHLQNAVERHRKLFDALLQRMLEVDISSGHMNVNVQVVEEAAEPKRPSNPRRVRNVAVYWLLGAFLGTVLAFFFENLDDTVKTPEDLKERLDVPLLGFVPRVPVGRKPSDEREFRYKGMISLFEPLSSVTEAYRNLRTSVFYSSPAGEMKVLALTSCTPREGKTTTVTNLALAIAQSGKRTLLIDADLHRPMVHRVFSLYGDTGLTNVLVGENSLQEAVQRVSFNGTRIDNLDVLAAGASSPNPSELVSSARMRDLVTAARDAYDWVLVDTPPVLFVSDTAVVCALCDGVAMIVKAGSSNRSLLNRARDQLATVQTHILGAVLNSMSVSRMGRHYSEYYHHGYSRYAKDYQRSYYADDRPRKKDKQRGKRS